MRFDAVVVGAGVVGIAIARALARSAYTVVVLEKENAVGTSTSSRNSEVIHAGLYYPTGSLKARLCVEGRRALYQFCTSHSVPYKKCGKLIVASNAAELEAISYLVEKGKRNGVEGLEELSQAQLRASEPELAGCGALLSTETGIFDSHAYIQALEMDAADHGAVFALRTPLCASTLDKGNFRVFAGGAEPVEISTRYLINCAGLHATNVALTVEGANVEGIAKTRYAKGSYFALTGKVPFKHLIYPAPSAHGLGVHLTFDLGGRARFGPDVEWVDEIDYSVKPDAEEAFRSAISAYWPNIRDKRLTPDYSGIRPKLVGPNDPPADFFIDLQPFGDSRLVNLLGIESPGLTSSIAIANYVLSLLVDRI